MDRNLPDLNYIHLEIHFKSNSMSWTISNNKLIRHFEFADFKEAFQFMTAVSQAINKMDHHPEWSNVYNKVTIQLQTHSAGNKVTQRDYDLAAAIDIIYQEQKA